MKFKLYTEIEVIKDKVELKQIDTLKSGKIGIREYIPKEFLYLTDEDLNKEGKIYVTVITTKVLEIEK